MVIEGRPFLFSVWMTCSSFESPLLSSAQARTVCFFFYRPSLNSDSMLIQTFKELKELTLNLFFSGLLSRVQKLVGKVGLIL